MTILQSGVIPSTGGYQISRSLRFNSADNAYLNRTLTTPTNNLKWTWSGWVKRSALGAASNLICGGDGTSNNSAWLVFNSSDVLQFYQLNGGSYNVQMTTSAVFRDVSAWYHIVLVYDSANATSTDRVQIYVNNVRQTVSYAVGPFAQNTASKINSAIAHYIGKLDYTTQYSNGYQTEVNFIDGQALTPSSFGQNNAQTGVWEPIAYTGTYGTNGFYLNFSDNSGTTSTTLGKDYSGNGNNWTPNNFSVTAGAGNDSLVDTPTSYGSDTGAGGEVRGNYCTLNPLAIKVASGTISVANGNLDTSDAATTYGYVPATMAVSSGKWYWEVFVTSQSNSTCEIGIKKNTAASMADTNGVAGTADGYSYVSSGSKRNNTSTSSYGNSWTTNDVIGVALDLDVGEIKFYKNGTVQNSGTAAFTGLSGEYFPAFGDYTNAGQFNYACNFGQRPFAYTAPSGFKALCTQNLPTPTIGATSTTQADNYFGVALYSGTGSGNSNVVSGLEFTTDFWWQKARNASTNHYLQDAVRGFGASKSLSSNTTAGEGVNGTPATQSLSVSSTGFTVSGSDFNGNTASETYVAWCWNAGGSNATNTSGTITSTVRANTTAGFSIATFTMPASGTSDTVGHGLGVAPAMVIVKSRGTSSWGVYHKNLTSAAYYLTLQTTNGETSSNSYWNSTAPTSTVFTVGATWYGAGTMVAYSFAPIAGYSAYGSYSGNNSSTDGAFVYLGFRPRFIMIKSTSAGTDWVMMDSARNTYNLADTSLYADSTSSESTIGTVNDIDFLSNGFKLRNNTGFVNASQTYVYAAFAESPFKYSLAR